ncbi:MAG: putative membrane protein insertion efficiency factor [Paracoccaceae bacterium]|jgi:putative membrane protein insertion efficiency factor
MIRKALSLASRALVLALSAPIHGYRLLLSPLIGRNCRYHPTCSAYALQALARHGPIRGLWLAIWRILRCHPWGGMGDDPVPPKRG